MRVAIIHDWLTGMRGGERCLEVLCERFPDAEIYSLFYNPRKISPRINFHKHVVSGLGFLPGIERFYRYALPFYPGAMRNLSRKLKRAHAEEPYELVLSVSHCAAKNIAVPRGVPHACYCLTPMRYIWDQYESYFGRSRIEPIVRHIARILRYWDSRGAERVRSFAGISNFVRERIERVYQRSAQVVYPPVRTDWIEPQLASASRDFFLVVNALVPYKNTDVIVEAFNKLGARLIVVGTGPEMKRLKKLAKANVEFLGNVSDPELAKLYAGCKALVFAAVEDFGMTPIEAQAAGRPVIAFGQGGALETVLVNSDSKTGLFFDRLNSRDIALAVEYFLDHQDKFTVNNCVRQAARFSTQRFLTDFETWLESLDIRLEPRAGNFGAERGGQGVSTAAPLIGNEF